MVNLELRARRGNKFELMCDINRNAIAPRLHSIDRSNHFCFQNEPNLCVCLTAPHNADNFMSFFKLAVREGKRINKQKIGNHL